MEELIPDFERYGIALNLEAHPYDFSETQRRRRADHPRPQPAVGELRVLRAARLPPVRRRRRRAPDDASTPGGKLPHLHIADCYNHRANVGNRYIINPPGVDARIHQHNEIGNGDLDWDEFFATLRERRLRRHRHGLRLRLGGRRRRHPPPDAGEADGRARRCPRDRRGVRPRRPRRAGRVPGLVGARAGAVLGGHPRARAAPPAPGLGRHPHLADAVADRVVRPPRRRAVPSWRWWTASTCWTSTPAR